jgi:hypothetical protein
MCDEFLPFVDINISISVCTTKHWVQVMQQVRKGRGLLNMMKSILRQILSILFARSKCRMGLVKKRNIGAKGEL